MIELAVATLIAIVVSNLWDLFDPDAIRTKVNSWPRAIFGIATGTGAMIVLLSVIGATTWQIIAALLAWVLLAALRAAVD